MKIYIFRNWTGAWTPTTEEWHRNRQLLHPLCVSGNIGFKKKEDLVSFLAANGIEACEETVNTVSKVSEQLLMF